MEYGHQSTRAGTSRTDSHASGPAALCSDWGNSPTPAQPIYRGTAWVCMPCAGWGRPTRVCLGLGGLDRGTLDWSCSSSLRVLHHAGRRRILTLGFANLAGSTISYFRRCESSSSRGRVEAGLVKLSSYVHYPLFIPSVLKWLRSALQENQVGASWRLPMQPAHCRLLKPASLGKALK